MPGLPKRRRETTWRGLGSHDVGYVVTPLKINMEHVLMEVGKMIFLSKWVMAVGSSRSSSRVYVAKHLWDGTLDPFQLAELHGVFLGHGG